MDADLAAEQAHLAFSRQSQSRMVERLFAVDPESAAEEITKEDIEVTVADAIEDPGGPGAGSFFGRIDCGDGRGDVDRWYVGRRHIEDDNHDPVVVDWRAPIAAPFYGATVVDSLGVDFRRQFTFDDGELFAYLDERLDDPDGSDIAGVSPTRCSLRSAPSAAVRCARSSPRFRVNRRPHPLRHRPGPHRAGRARNR